MATLALTPVSEYLSTTYRPDCDYIDGEVRERNVGERPHTRLQMILGAIFEQHLESWHALVMGDQRVQILPDRYRVADVCVVRDTDPDELIVRTPPLLCIEILSRGDSLGELQERVDDYVRMGVRTVWAIDPWKRLGYHADETGFLQPHNGMLQVADTQITIRLDELFDRLGRKG